MNNSADGPNGLPVIRAQGGGLTISGGHATIERSAAAGTPAFRIFDVAPNASLTLRNVTVQGGLVCGGQSLAAGPIVTTMAAQGGAIFNKGTLSLDGVTLQNNAAHGFDGSYFWGIRFPAIAASGGAIYSVGALTATGCNVQNNQAIGGRGADRYVTPRSDPGNTGGGTLPATDGASGLGGGVYVAGGSAPIAARPSHPTPHPAAQGASAFGRSRTGNRARELEADFISTSQPLPASTTIRRLTSL